ncbi:hypothetical protein [Streptococcus plurextorum]|uniref:hypothetical protein n=1 Tax=Streptococcus plurextorum TaxID=456876 RepID=UPI0003FEB3C7|nr:hypothetical protein [Streptococcus plurextorum]
MAKITYQSFTKNLQEVTLQKTEKTIKISEKSGAEYTVEYIPNLQVLAITAPAEHNGKYRYSIIDTKNDLEYTVTAPTKVEAKFGTPLIFKNVRGGLMDKTVWFAAESVSILQRNNV